MVALAIGDGAQRRQQPLAAAVRRVVQGERSVQPGAGFGVQAAEVPVHPQRGGDLPDQLGVAGLQPEFGGGAQVADIRRQHRDRALLGLSGAQGRVHPVREAPEVIGVAGLQPWRLAGGGQPLGGEVADGLEQPEPWFGRIVASL